TGALVKPLPVPEEINVFDDDFVRELSKQSAPLRNQRFEQLLIFQDNRQLRGKLVSLGKDEIEWRRGDIAETIHFQPREVRSIVFSKPQSTAGNEHSKETEVRATVQFSGGDWL